LSIKYVTKEDKKQKFWIKHLGEYQKILIKNIILKLSLTLTLALIKMGDEIANKIVKILKENSKTGLTITELVKVSKLSRHIVLTALAKLEGADKVFIRKAGMAKIYSLKKSEENLGLIKKK